MAEKYDYEPAAVPASLSEEDRKEIANVLKMAKAVASRLDMLEEGDIGDLRDQVGSLEQKVKETADNVHALGRGIASISNRLDLLRRPVAVPDPEPEEEEEGEGGRDWLAVDDPEVAFEWLVELDEWHDKRYRWLVGKALPECWPWHPRAVVELLAMHEQYVAAYGSDNPTLRSDFLGRWLKYGHDQVTNVLAECGPGTHLDRVLGQTKADPSELRNLAAWWALDRDNNSEEVLKSTGLIPRT